MPFSRLFCDYIEKSEQTIPFYNGYHSYEVLREVVSGYRFQGDRKAAAEILAGFNASFSLDAKARENLTALADDDTVTITTGQQVNLVGGPLYTVFKTLSVIQLAKVLSRDTGRNVVPVFWLADEDHDYDEIAVATLPGKKKPLKVTLPCDDCARHAAGSLQVDDKRFETFRKEVYELLPDTDFHHELTKLLNDCYRVGNSFRDAFGQMLAHLFSGHGLIFAGSNFPEAKKLTTGKIRTAIVKADAVKEELTKQSEQIAANYHQQAHVSDSLLFWHDDTHGRVRLKHDDGVWSREPNVTLTTDELLEKLQAEPERFSPNVYLRPVIQDALLPNAAYVGGPAEIAYYGQMKGLYRLFEQEMPFLAARLSATLVEPSVYRLLKDLPYEYSDYVRRFEDLEQHYLRNYGDPELDAHFEKWKQEVEELTRQKTTEIGIEDPGLKKHSQAITKEHIKAIDKLRKKVVNAVRQKEEVQINRLKKVKSALFPDDRLQEREISFIYFMNKYGPDIWNQILEQLDTDSPSLFTRHLYIHL